MGWAGCAAIVQEPSPAQRPPAGVDAAPPAPPVAPECVGPPPEMVMETTRKFSAEELAQLGAAARASDKEPIVGLREMPIASAELPDKMKPDLVMDVTVFESYDRCAGAGRNAVTRLARVNGSWVFVARFVEYVRGGAP